MQTLKVCSLSMLRMPERPRPARTDPVHRRIDPIGSVGILCKLNTARSHESLRQIIATPVPHLLMS